MHKPCKTSHQPLNRHQARQRPFHCPSYTANYTSLQRIAVFSQNLVHGLDAMQLAMKRRISLQDVCSASPVRHMNQKDGQYLQRS